MASRANAKCLTAAHHVVWCPKPSRSFISSEPLDVITRSSDSGRMKAGGYQRLYIYKKHIFTLIKVVIVNNRSRCGRSFGKSELKILTQPEMLHFLYSGWSTAHVWFQAHRSWVLIWSDYRIFTHSSDYLQGQSGPQVQTKLFSAVFCRIYKSHVSHT